MSATVDATIAARTVTPVGEYWMQIKSDIVVRAGFGAVPQELRSYTHTAHPYLDAVDRYFAGDIDALSNIKYQQKGSVFHEAVWRAMSTIKPGQPTSYKQLAVMAGYPNAFRAVGTACGANYLPLIVPCHRVVRADGSAGNYAFGTDVKVMLLAHENRS